MPATAKVVGLCSGGIAQTMRHHDALSWRKGVDCLLLLSSITECERREPVCQPPWKLTQLSSASTLRAPAGDEPAVALCRRSAAGALCTASTTENLFRVLERNGTQLFPD